MNAEESEEMRRYLVGSRASFALPIKSGKIVSLAQNGSFSGVVMLAQDVKMQQSAGKFKIRDRDCAMRIFVGDELAGNLGWPLISP
jgi:hypothetical protein